MDNQLNEQLTCKSVKMMMIMMMMMDNQVNWKVAIKVVV